jgi:hypothetical protein
MNYGYVTQQSLGNAAPADFEDEELVEILADQIMSDVLDRAAYEVADYLDTRSQTQLQSLSADPVGASGAEDELESIAERLSDEVSGQAEDVLIDIELGDIATGTSTIALQSVGVLEPLGWKSFWRGVGRKVKSGAKKAGKALLKEGAKRAGQWLISLLGTVAPGGLQPQGIGDFFKRIVRSGSSAIRKGLSFIKDQIMEFGRRYVRDGLGRVRGLIRQLSTEDAQGATLPGAPSDDSGSVPPWAPLTQQSAVTWDRDVSAAPACS